MKIKYERPEIKHIDFDNLDVLTTSPGQGGEGNGGLSNNDNSGNSPDDYNF